MKKIYIILSFLVFWNVLIAQPRFGDQQGNLKYRDHELLINPATLGAVNQYVLGLSLYKQWTGIESSPLSELLQYQMSLNQNSGFGAWVYNESYGVQNNTQFAGAYSFKIKLKESTLALGLSASLLMMHEKQVAGAYRPDDPAFANPPANQLGFNTGFGIYYFGKKYHVGFSIPQILTNDFETGVAKPKLTNTLDFGRMQYYFTGGYCFDISEKISLKPAALMEISGATSLGYEFMFTAEYDRRFEAGIGMAAHSCIQFSAGAEIIKSIALRYQYAHHLSNDYNRIGGSHFIVLRLTF